MGKPASKGICRRQSLSQACNAAIGFDDPAGSANPPPASENRLPFHFLSGRFLRSWVLRRPGPGRHASGFCRRRGTGGQESAAFPVFPSGRPKAGSLFPREARQSACAGRGTPQCPRRRFGGHTKARGRGYSSAPARLCANGAAFSPVSGTVAARSRPRHR